MSAFTTSITITTALLALAASNTAVAAPASPHERHAIVYAADLDLGREPDAQALYERIGYAASAICVMDESSFEPRKEWLWRQCVEAAVTDAVERTNVPLLTAVHRQPRAPWPLP